MLANSNPFSGFSVDSQAAAKEFYENVLGITVVDNGMGLELTFANGHKVFIYEKADHLPASFTVLNFQVTNINEAVDELSAKGVQMERYSTMPGDQDERGIMRGKAANMGPDIAWFKDPAANVLAVLEN